MRRYVRGQPLDASFRRRLGGASCFRGDSFRKAAAKRSTIAIRGAEAQRARPHTRHKDPQDKRPMAPLLHLRRISRSLSVFWSLPFYVPTTICSASLRSPFAASERERENRDLRARTYARGRCLLNFHDVHAASK